MFINNRYININSISFSISKFTNIFIISRNLDSEITEWKLFTNYLFEDFIMLTSYNNRISILNLPDLKEVVSKSGTEHKIEDFEVSEDRSFAMILE